jgi:hypothetical protein
MLKDFYVNTAMRDEVKTYLIDFLKIQAIDKAFKKEDTSAIAEAKEIIDKAFDELDLLFSPQVQEKEVKNPAR